MLIRMTGLRAMLIGALAVAACAGAAPEPSSIASSTPPASEGSSPSAEPTSSAPSSTSPSIDGVRPVSGPSVEGSGPILAWDSVPGAATYEVTVVAEDGIEVPWVWIGEESRVEFGAISIMSLGLDLDAVEAGDLADYLPSSLGSARPGATYRWVVIAQDADGRAITGSGVQTFECTSPCGE